MHESSFLDVTQAAYLEDLQNQYRREPETLEPGWRRFFEGFELANSAFPVLGSLESGANPDTIRRQIGVLNLIYAYRSRGHLIADINPIRARADHKPNLDLHFFGLSESDLDAVFEAGSEIGIGPATLRDILAHLKRIYCGPMAVEYMHKRKPEVIHWFQQHLEPVASAPSFSMEEKKIILRELNEAEVFEKFLQAKYVGQKRFSLEGGEVLIPALEFLIRKGAQLGAQQFIFGSAHRGRLNLLTNILGKTYEDVFSEFEDFYEAGQGAADVKYHMGYSTVRDIDGDKVKLTLAFNPSHLESVDPVVLGMTRAKAEQWFGGHYKSIVPVLIHGDAALAGQGIVYECLQMQKLPGYTVGGTVHIVINNQIGFTTDHTEGRSTIYCTDVAKTIQAPIFHVNGQDPEAVIHAIRLAIEYRQEFGRDVFIDILCFRKYGHNEADEPRFTQPLLYKRLDQMPSVREAYVRHLNESGVIESRLSEEMEADFSRLLSERIHMAREQKKASSITALQSKWAGFRFAKPEDFDRSPITGADPAMLRKVANALLHVPGHFHPIKKISNLIEDRRKLLEAGKVTWATAELMAYGTLLMQGYPIRLSGEDVKRGTFSHRHAVFMDEETEAPYIQLDHIDPEQKVRLMVHNSHLSEYGVLGFEHGYSLSTPNRLTIWEAQFGDFSNGAQIILDQFISSSEEKWRLSSGLVLLLPHGHEGQGPEHTSARVERYLQLCAQYNMQVVNCTTPANLYHAMRRQLLRDFRKPLIVFTPKSMLRHPEVISQVSDLEGDTCFRELIDDADALPKSTTRVLLCTGKIYYELLARKRELDRKDVAIVRLEQLYPLPRMQIRALVERYGNVNEWLWVQEEPINMGAWDYLNRSFTERKLRVVCRPQAASPAEGSLNLHKRMQSALIDSCFQAKDQG